MSYEQGGHYCRTVRFTLGQVPPLRAALQGFLLWQSYINAQGGTAVQNGEKKPVRLIWYDDRSQISCAGGNVTRLLREDQIDILLGPYSSSLTMAAADITEEYKKVLWNRGGSSDEIFSHLSCHGQARATAANHLRETRG